MSDSDSFYYVSENGEKYHRESCIYIKGKDNLKKYSIDEVLSACRYYFQKTGRRLTFEYSLVGGENDSQEDAEELARLIKGLNCHVNLIPVNPIKERNYVQSDKKVIENFQNKLEKYQINVTIRREMGRDIDGACGQLRKRYLDKREDS